MYNIFEDYDRPAPGEGPFYTLFLRDILYGPEAEYYGLDKCDWHETTYTHIATHKERLIERFNNTYLLRELGQETPSRWQHFLQTRLDEVIEFYDHAYKVYEENEIDQLGTGYMENEEYDRNSTSEGSENTESTSNQKFKDTPISGTVNNPTTEQDDTDNSSTDSNVNSTDHWERTKQKTEHNDEMITEVNRLANAYRSIDNEFIESFDNMFMGCYPTFFGD